MCEISTEIKLCTCIGEVNKQDNYWEFHRYVEGKNLIVVGSTSWSAIIDPAENKKNKAILLEALNTGNPFDVDLQQQKQDRLVLFFQTTGNVMGTHLAYGFEYDGKKWKGISYDSLTWMWKHEEERDGEITYPERPKKLPFTA